MPQYYIGVDVGTGSARAALVSTDGSTVQTTVEPIQILNPQPSFYEQSSDDIWRAVVVVVNVSKLCKFGQIKWHDYTGCP